MGETPRGLIALICAYKPLEDAEAGLRAMLPIAGRTLLERQGRAAAAAGAEALLIATDPAAPAIKETAERLKREGLQVLLVRGISEAARALEPDDRVLLIGDGALLDEEEMVRLSAADGFALLTVADIGRDERFERIDADSRWAGAAMIDGRLVRQTAPMLQDWDMQSTLLRRAVQDGARHLRLDQEVDPIMAEGPDDLVALEQSIMAGASGAQRDWVSRYMLAPLETALTKRLVGHRVTAWHLIGAGLLLQLAALFTFLTGWFWPGLAMFLLSTPLLGTGERLCHLTGSGRFESLLRRALPPAAAACLISLGYGVSIYEGWGALVLAAATIAFACAAEGERPRRSGRGIFLAEPKGLAWLLLPFAAAGQWAVGLGAMLVYAAASFFIAQRQAHGRSAGGGED